MKTVSRFIINTVSNKRNNSMKTVSRFIINTGKFFLVLLSVMVCGRTLGVSVEQRLIQDRVAINTLDFPIGIFSAGHPTDDNFSYIKRLGFDYIHKYGLAEHDTQKVQNYMDMAEKHRLKVMLDVSGPLTRLAKGEITEKEAIENFTMLIKRWKDHAALGFWYIYDEPSYPGMPPERLMAFHKIVKMETPDIPDAIALAWVKHWWDWTKCADIIMPDYYPVRDAEFPISMLNHQSEFFSKISKKCDYMVPIVQCFGFPKYPNETELRYIMFSTLPQKTRGLFFWSYWRSRIVPLKNGELKPDYLETKLKPILAEFKQFIKLIKPAHKVLLVPNLEQKMYSSKQIMVGIWKMEKKMYIVMINSWPEAREISFPLSPHIINAELKPIFSTRSISNLKVINGNLKLRVLPWETFIWETPVISVETIKTKSKI